MWDLGYAYELPTSEPPTDETGSSSLRLLPTPVVTDSYGSRRSTARTDEWVSNPGTSLTDAIWETQGRTTDTLGKTLPGASTPLPSGDGNEPSDDRHLPQLMIEAG